VKNILPLALAGVVAASSLAVAAYPNLYSTGQVPPNLSVVSISTSSVLNVRSFGAAGDGVTDDTAAFIAAIQRVNTLLSVGTPATLYIPAGVYYLNGTTALPTFNRGGSLIGDGPHKTYIMLGPAYAGDVFSWSEAWMKSAYSGTALSAVSDQAGAYIRGLSILGSRTYSNQQNAFVFYDRDDMIDMRDVQVFFLNGRALYMGVSKSVPGHAYVRESRFADMLFWECGTSSLPVMEINSVGPAGEDATNELSFYAIDVIGPIGQGVVIRNSNASIGVRLIRFYGLRVEGGAPGESGDLLDIGDPTLPGNVNNIQIYGFESNTAPAGSAAVRFTAASGSSQPYNITLQGTIPSSNGDGVHVDAGRQIRIHLADDYTPSGTGITIGPSTMVGGYIDVDGDGAETSWSYNIDPSSLYQIHTPAYPLFGNPSTGTARAIIASGHPDGTAAGGGTRGSNAIDLQTARTSASQIASGNYSVLLGGQNNAASGQGSAQVGGSGNANSALYGFGGGGQANTLSGSNGVLAGGYGNSATGAYSAIPGGLYATDRGRYGSMAFASGNFGGSNTGDAQKVESVLRAAVASGGTGQMTADGAAAGTANILNLSAGMAGTYSGYVTVRDTVTGAMYSFFLEFGAKRPGAASTTAITWQNVVAKGGDAALANVTVTVRADTTNGGVTLAVNNTTSPSGNTLHLAFAPAGAEVQ